MKNVSDNSCRENQNTVYFLFPKILRFMR